MKHPVDKAMASFRKERIKFRLFEMLFILMIAATLAWPISKAGSYYNIIQAKAAAYDEIQAYLAEQTKVVE